jgi:uncharacterized membrane protein
MGTSGWVRGSRLRQLGWLVVLFTVLFYAPLAFTYFLHGPTQHRLQDDVMMLLVSPGFAFGLGSGYDGHIATYIATYPTMWTHTVAGTLALVAGFLQFSDRVRTRFPALHRLLGRVYLVSAMIVAGSAIAYLVRTGSAQVFSGKAFAEVLWLLAIGTLTAGGLALAAILRRDVAAHRELVALSYALICSAPLLRIGWLTIAQLWHTTKEMINLTEGSWAGPLLITGAIVYTRRYGHGRGRQHSPLCTERAAALAAVASTLGVVALCVFAARTHWSNTPDWFVGGWGPLVVFFVIPYLVQFAGFAAMAQRARLRGDLAALTAWRTYLLALIATPALSALMLGYATGVHHIPLSQAWWAAPLGWNLALFVTFAGHVTLTTTFARRRAPALISANQPVAVS